MWLRFGGRGIVRGKDCGFNVHGRRILIFGRGGLVNYIAVCDLPVHVRQGSNPGE